MTMFQVLLDGLTVTDEYGNIVAQATSSQHATAIACALNAIAEARAHHAGEYGWIDPMDWDRFTAQDIVAVGEGQTTFENITWGIAWDEDPHYLGSPEDSKDRVRIERVLEERERRKLANWLTSWTEQQE